MVLSLYGLLQSENWQGKVGPLLAPLKESIHQRGGQQSSLCFRVLSLIVTVVHHTS